MALKKCKHLMTCSTNPQSVLFALVTGASGRIEPSGSTLNLPERLSALTTAKIFLLINWENPRTEASDGEKKLRPI